MVIIKAFLMALLPVVVSAVIFKLSKKGLFPNENIKGLVAGIALGAVAVLCTEFGIDTGKAVLNTRDASVMCAGMFFGWRASAVAALIGGIERFLCPLWGLGAYTRVACSVATLAAGLITSLLVVFVYDKKRPFFYQGFITSVVIEVFHMLLVIVTHWEDIHSAFYVVDETALLLISINSLSVAAAVVVIDLIDDRKVRIPQKKTVGRQISAGLSVTMFVGLIITVLFTTKVQDKINLKDTDAMLRSIVLDIENELSLGRETSELDEEYFREGPIKFRHVGTSGSIVISDSDGDVVFDLDDTEYDSAEEMGLSSDPENAMVMTTGTVKGTASYYIYDYYNGFTVYAILPSSEADLSRKVSTYLTQFMEILLFGALFVVLIQIMKRVILNNVSRINKDLKEITDGNLNVTVMPAKNSEFTSIANGINSTVGKLKDMIEEAKKSMEKELMLARQIQYESVPHLFPPFPNRKDVDVYALMTTAKDVGGDFYDYFFINSEKLFFLIADVSGKGVPAAMFMMKAKTLIRNLAKTEPSVSEIFRKANNGLCENNESGMFVTCWMASLDVVTGELEYCSAGHNPPVYINDDGNAEFIRDNSGLVLSGLPEMKYRQFSMKLNPGDKIFLYTDGVTEANNGKKQMYSEERLIDELVLLQKKNVSLKEVCEGVHSSVDLFAAGEEQFDDITVLCLQYNGKKTDKESKDDN